MVVDKRFRGGARRGDGAQKAKRRKDKHDDRHRITMDDIIVKPFKAKKKVNKNQNNTGAGFMTSLGYSGSNGFKANYKCPNLAREILIFSKPLSVAREVEDMQREDEEIKRVRKHCSVGCCSRGYRPMKDDRDQYLMRDLNNQKWGQEGEVQEFHPKADSSASCSQEEEEEEDESSLSHSSIEPDQEDVYIGLRRRSCVCTGCSGAIKRPRRKGDIIVLPDELLFLRNHHTQLKQQQQDRVRQEELRKLMLREKDKKRHWEQRNKAEVQKNQRLGLRKSFAVDIDALKAGRACLQIQATKSQAVF